MLLLLQTSCLSIVESEKIAHFKFFNRSSDIASLIQIQLIAEDQVSVIDVIEIRQELAIGDSLDLAFNTENFAHLINYTPIRVNIYFKNQRPILNNMAIDKSVAGSFQSKNSWKTRIYFGDENMVSCLIFNNDPKYLDCSLDLLK